MVLSKMREIAETYLGGRQPITHAVITTPAYFNNSQRQAVKDAGEISGLNVLRIINEPTAAAIAYGLGKKGVRTILIFDFGGGTLDVSLLRVDDDNFEVLATAGDSNLGGEDFDNQLTQHLVELFKTRNHKDLKTDARAMKRLKNYAERAKRALSFAMSASIQIDGLSGTDFNVTLSRAKFEEINQALLQRCVGPVEQVLRDGKIPKARVDDIVLVGGSSRMPWVQNMLSEMFQKPLNKSINPDEAIAYGATIQAAVLTGSESSTLSGLVLVDVIPLSLGIEILGGRMSVVIPRNTSIPARRSANYVTAEDNQTTIGINLYEGERDLIEDNHLLGKFQVDGLRPLPKGKVSVEVTFEIDANGILQVHAIEKSTGASGNITISTKNRGLTGDQIARLLQEAEANQARDKERRGRIEADLLLKDYIEDLRQMLSENRTIPSLLRSSISNAARDVEAWRSSNAATSTAAAIQEKRVELKTLVDSLFPGLSSQARQDDGFGQSGGSAAHGGATQPPPRPRAQTGGKGGGGKKGSSDID